MRDRVKEITSRSNGIGDLKRKKQLQDFVRGWVNYFKLANMKMLLIRTDEWMRRRIRMVIWKQWKRVRTRGRNLQKLGLNKYKAWEYANTRKSYWNTANSPILSRTLTNERLKKAGYINFSDYYHCVKIKV